MILESHYIFLPKENQINKNASETNENGEFVINLSMGVGGYITDIFTDSSIVQDNENIFKKEYHVNIVISGISFVVVLSQYDVGKNVYLGIKVEGKTKLQIVKCLEYVQESILNSGIEDEYYVVISYDAISEYYCNKIYPKLNSLERKLRRLLFNTYIVNFDKAYYEITISEELQAKGKGVIQAKGNAEKKKERRIKEFFYSLEFFDIQQMLFSPTWTDYDEDQKQDFLKKHSDLTQLSDEELRNHFADFSPKSDWDRFFKHKTDNPVDDIITFLDEIRVYRNKIAHCKFLTSNEYKECNRAILKLSHSIDQALAITEEKDFLSKNIESLRESFGRIKEKLEALSSIIVSSAVSAFKARLQSSSILQRFGESMKKLNAAIVQAAIQSFESSYNTDEIEDNDLPDNVLTDEDDTDE